MASAVSLTQHDNVVLNQLFDLEAAPSDITVDSSLPADPHITEPESLRKVQAEEKAIILRIENLMRSSSSPSEKDHILFQARTSLIALQQEYKYAGLWNDLAQTLRLQHGDNVLLSTTSVATAAQISTASTLLSALDTCIALLTPTTLPLRVSPLQARTLSSALLQRGALFNATAKELAKNSDSKIVVEKHKSWTKEDFQQAASEAFFEAGRLGNDLGKALAVHTNPTAKLCGQMVRDAMRSEMGRAD